jgi:predicted transcriptional regulator of viral defense system
MIHLIEPPAATTRKRRGSPKGRRAWGCSTRMRKFFAENPQQLLNVDEATATFGIGRPATASMLSRLVTEGYLERVNAYKLKTPTTETTATAEGYDECVACPKCFVVFKP